MPREEHDREDLLREATALIERAELRVADCDAPVVVGFRDNGSFSVFFGGDPVYQFNSAGQLRRAYVAGLLYKAQHGHLMRLRRERTATETALWQQSLGPEDEKTFLADAKERLDALSSALEEQRFTLIGKVPADADAVDRTRRWLSDLPPEIQVAERPHNG
jgi:hypothetical protein